MKVATAAVYDGHRDLVEGFVNEVQEAIDYMELYEEALQEGPCWDCGAVWRLVPKTPEHPYWSVSTDHPLDCRNTYEHDCSIRQQLARSSSILGAILG